MKRHLPALAAYVLLSLLFLAPVLPHVGQAIPGGALANTDGWQNVWNLWWVHHALSSGSDPFYTTYLYWRDGVGLHLQTLNASNGVLVFPITALSGAVAAYNTALLLALVLAAVGGYALALHVSGHRGAAFVGGLVFAFAPFHIVKLWDGQLELFTTQWIPFYALFLLRTAERGTWRDALLAGVFLALVGYTSWYYFLYTAVFSVAFVLLWLPTRPDWRQRGALLGQMAGVALAGAALLLPVLLPALHLGAVANPQINPDSRVDPILMHSANLFDFLLPSYLHPLWGEAALALGLPWHPFNAAWNLAPGYGVLALAVLGSAAAWREGAWRWAALALLAALLALGPLLHVGEQRTGIPLPYMLLLHLPGAGVGRRPNHFFVITLLALVPLVALGVRWLLRAPRQAWQVPLLVLLLTLVAVEYAPPRYSLYWLHEQVHPYNATLTGQPGALLNLPPRGESSGAMLAQLFHRKPIMGGYVARTPPYPFAKQAPGVRQLWAMEPENSRLLQTAPDDLLVALNHYGLEHIIIEADLLDSRRGNQMRATLREVLPGVAPVYTDEHISAYEVPAVPSRPVAFFGQGWHAEEHTAARRWRWMKEAGELLLLNPTGRPALVNLTLTAESHQPQQTVQMALGEQELFGWHFAQPERQTIELHMLLLPGEHRLHLSAPGFPEPGDDRMMSIVLVGSSLDWQLLE